MAKFSQSMNLRPFPDLNLSKHGLRLENEITDDATQSTLLTQIRIEATGDEER